MKTEILKLLAAVGIALGSHFVTPDAKAQAIADVIAITIAARNRAITKPADEPPPAFAPARRSKR